MAIVLRLISAIAFALAAIIAFGTFNSGSGHLQVLLVFLSATWGTIALGFSDVCSMLQELIAKTK